MLLILDEDHKQHISILITQSEQVLQDFCKLALEYLKKGQNPKLYQSAAQKLNVQSEIIRNAVEGLLHLLVRSCKEKLSDLDFRDSMLTLGFSKDHVEILSAFFTSKKEEILHTLNNDSLEMPHYKNMEWRFEAQLASRSLKQQITPLITMKLALENRRGNLSVSQENIVLQTDPTNLIHLTQVMEEALAEARSQHTRKLQRQFK